MAENQQDPKAGGVRGIAADGTRTWRTYNFPNAAAVVEWLNRAPAQGPGEAFASSRPDGSVDGYAYF